MTAQPAMPKHGRPDIPGLLRLLQDWTAGSEEYFVSGSLSFLPVLGSYREPGHDVDVAVSQGLFTARWATPCRLRRSGGCACQG
jgi:hypothetical protein